MPSSDSSADKVGEAREIEDELSNSVDSRTCAPLSSRGYILLVRGLSGCSAEPEDSELREEEVRGSLQRLEL